MVSMFAGETLTVTCPLQPITKNAIVIAPEIKNLVGFLYSGLKFY